MYSESAVQYDLLANRVVHVVQGQRCVWVPRALAEFFESDAVYVPVVQTKVQLRTEYSDPCLWVSLCDIRLGQNAVIISNDEIRMLEYLTYLVLTLLLIIVCWEWLRSRAFVEGFTDGVVPAYFARWFPRRSDVAPGQQRESEGWIRNPRYFEGYVDVQRLGYKADFCRVLEKEDAPESRIMACALAGQEGLDPFLYRTESSRAGFRFSRDDYFRDVNDDGREDYGRILKIAEAPNDAWEATAVLAGVDRFKPSEIPDHEPPPEIAELLYFFEGLMVWYRFYDDILDYAENTQVSIAGKASVDETPKRISDGTKTNGLRLNMLPAGSGQEKPPQNQFLKIGEYPRLEFDSKISLRNLRGISTWVYFEEFTQNARIFDFGNGAGKDNVLLGIEGKGNDPGAFGRLNARPPADAKVCRTRFSQEVSPQEYLASSDANVDEWECPDPELVDSIYPKDEIAPSEEKKANLLFEIWDAQQRKMRIRVLNCIPLKKWVHIALTTTDNLAFRPTWEVYIDGERVFREEDGHMPLQNYTTKNYIGRSNWEGVTSQYEDADERLRGALFDLRFYRTPMSVDKIKRTVQWGKRLLTEV